MLGPLLGVRQVFLEATLGVFVGCAEDFEVGVDAAEALGQFFGIGLLDQNPVEPDARVTAGILLDETFGEGRELHAGEAVRFVERRNGLEPGDLLVDRGQGILPFGNLRFEFAGILAPGRAGQIGLGAADGGGEAKLLLLLFGERPPGVRLAPEQGREVLGQRGAQGRLIAGGEQLLGLL